MLSYHAPPRAVRTPRSFSAVAMARNVVAPAACIWRTMGSTLAAKASAASRFAATPRYSRERGSARCEGKKSTARVLTRGRRFRVRPIVYTRSLPMLWRGSQVK